MSKQGAQSRWNGGVARFAERMMDDDRQVRDKAGRFRRKQDNVSETQWLERRRSPQGYFRGARISRHIALAVAADLVA